MSIAIRIALCICCCFCLTGCIRTCNVEDPPEDIEACPRHSQASLEEIQETIDHLIKTGALPSTQERLKHWNKTGKLPKETPSANPEDEE